MIATAFRNALDGVLKRRLQERAQRDMVVKALVSGFTALPKKQVPDYAERLKKLEIGFKQMSEDVRIEFANGRIVIRVSGASESLLTELRRGTEWYEPWDKVDETILAAILVDTSK